MSDWRIENRYTIGFTTVLVLGLYALGAGGYSLFGLLLLLNLNYTIRNKD